jgi:hypothetical protein
MKYLLFLALCLTFSFGAIAQSDEVVADKEIVHFSPEFQDWWASNGYMIQSDVKLSADMPDISEVMSTSGDHYLTEEIIFSSDFDPRKYMIVLPDHHPLVYTIGNSGKVLYFHSAYRALELHKRYEINQKAKSNR